MKTHVMPYPRPDDGSTEHPHITRSDHILNGSPILRGTRIPVRLIAQIYRAGDSVDDILQSYPHLSAAAVHDAISYYLDHQSEIEAEIVDHRIDNVLAATGASMDERGFVTFPRPVDNG